MRFKIIITLTIFFLSILKVSAQDLVLMTDGDTLKGKISSTNFFQIRLKANSKKVLILNANEVDEFYKNRQRYLSREVFYGSGNQRTFVKVEISGLVNFLVLKSRSSGTSIVNPGYTGGMIVVGGGTVYNCFIEKAGDNSVLYDVNYYGKHKVLVENTRIRIASILGDKENVLAKINRAKKFTPRFVSKLVEEYNKK